MATKKNVTDQYREHLTKVGKSPHPDPLGNRLADLRAGRPQSVRPGDLRSEGLAPRSGGQGEQGQGHPPGSQDPSGPFHLS